MGPNGSGSGRAADAPPSRGPSLQSGFRYGAAARLTGAVGPDGKPSHRALDLREMETRLRDERADLRPFEGDCRALWVVLVVGVGVERRGDDGVVVVGQRGQAGDDHCPLRLEQGAQVVPLVHPARVPRHRSRVRQSRNDEGGPI